MIVDVVHQGRRRLFDADHGRVGSHRSMRMLLKRHGRLGTRNDACGSRSGMRNFWRRFVQLSAFFFQSGTPVIHFPQVTLLVLLGELQIDSLFFIRNSLPLGRNGTSQVLESNLPVAERKKKTSDAGENAVGSLSVRESSQRPNLESSILLTCALACLHLYETVEHPRDADVLLGRKSCRLSMTQNVRDCSLVAKRNTMAFLACEAYRSS